MSQNYEDYQDNITCPICSDLLLIPRMYGCGHNICEECMIKADKMIQDELPSSGIPIYKCPICREESISEWYSRPVNTTLIDLLSKISEEYRLRHKAHQRRDPLDVPEYDIPSGINLGFVSKNIREFKTNLLYEKIIPILYKAAMQAKPHVTISSDKYDISLVADLLAKRLINENGIYRLTVGPRECQIEFVPSERSYRYEYRNENFDSSQPIIINRNYSDQSEQSEINRSEQSEINQSEQTEINQSEQTEINQSEQTEINQSEQTETIPSPSQTALSTLESTINSTLESNLETDLTVRTNNNPIQRAEIVSVSVHDSNGQAISDTQSREVSNMLVNHILQNLQNRRTN